MKTVPTEHMEQATLVSWLEREQPEVLFFAIPNGAHLAGSAAGRAKQVKKLKAEGMQVGVPDIMIAEPNDDYHGLFVEMKRIKNSNTSEDQKKFIAKLIARGYKAVVCKGHERAKAEVECYLKSTTSTTISG